MWSSADASVATVGPAGLVVGLRTGNTTISAASGGVSGQIAITVIPGVPAKLVIITQPTGATSGVRLTTQPVVEVRDQADNLVVNTPTTVTASVVGSGAISGTTQMASQQGVVRYTDLAVSGFVGGRTLQFTASGVTPANSAVFDVAAGPPSQIDLAGDTPRLRSGIPSGVTTGQSAIAVQLRDADGNPTSLAGRRVTATVTGGAGTTVVANAVATTNAQGRATFSTLTVTGLAGARTLRFAADSIAAPITTTLTLLGGRPTRLAIERDLPATTEVGLVVSPVPIVRLLDSIGNAAPEVGIAVRAGVLGGGGTLTNNTATTDTLGRATFTGLTVFDGSGVRTVQFLADGYTGVNSRQITVAPADTFPQPAFLTTAVSSADTTVRVLELSNMTAAFTPFLQARNAQQAIMPTSGVRWFSRDASRATVSADGRITGALPGRTFVVAQGSRTPTVADSILVFVPKNSTGPILRATLPSYRIRTDTFSIVFEIISRDGRPFSAVDFEVAWPGSRSSVFSPFNVTTYQALRQGVTVQQVDGGQQNLRVTWASTTPVTGSVQLLRLGCVVNQRNVGNQVVLTLNQLLAGDLTDLTQATSVFNPVVIIP